MPHSNPAGGGRPLLYVSRLLPEAVMLAIRRRFHLVNEPTPAAPSRAELAENLQRAEAAIVTLAETIDADLIRSVPRLRILSNYAVGYNNIDLVAAARQGLVVTNTPDVLTDATADLTWALLLATVRRVVEGDQLMRSGAWTGWTPTHFLSGEVTGRTLGIVGFGRIGQAVARRASGFRMRVIYHTRRPAPSPEPWTHVSLPELLRDADMVSLHAPLTDQTRHLIGAKELTTMQKSAVLINTARGPLVDESALVSALENGTISGAGLDVYEEEPAVHPGLIASKKAVLLPHLGSATWAARVHMGMLCLANIEAVLAGKEAPNRIRTDS